jgi:enoyl-CoA hydratase/carnithine racemase
MAPREAQLVAARVGPTLAAEVLLAAAALPAERLYGVGFLNALLSPDELGEAVAQRIAQVAALSPMAARANKATLRALQERDADVEALVATAYAYAGHAEHREGIDAFLNKRAARFGSS